MNPFACAAHRSNLIPCSPLVVMTGLAAVRRLARGATASDISRNGAERAWQLDRVASGSALCLIERNDSNNTSRGPHMNEHLPGSSAKTSPRIFETRNLPLAAFLISGRYLHYAGLRVEDGRGVFAFDDPQGQGPVLEAEFHSGGECPATLFHSVVKRLRREIDTAIARDGGR